MITTNQIALVDKQEINIIPVPYQVDWGKRARVKRVGNMIYGHDSAPLGIKTYFNKFANLPDYEEIKDHIHLFEIYQEIRYLKARSYGLNHKESLFYTFIE